MDVLRCLRGLWGRGYLRWMGGQSIKWPRKVEDQLAKVASVADAEPLLDEALAILDRALKGKVGLVVASAAKVIARRTPPGFDGALLEAFDRLTEDAAKRDPNCRAKLAIVEALTALGVDAESVARRGLTFVQMEATWGKPVDTAPALRSLCARFLVDLRVWDLMARLVDLLADPEHPARLGAVEALVASGRAEASYVLRLKARLRDPEPEVTGRCFEGVLALDEEEGVAFVADQLNDADGAIVDYALLALGDSRRPDALAPITAWLEGVESPTQGRMALAALVAHRSEAATAYLLRRLAENPVGEARAVLEALAPMAFDPRVSARVCEVVSKRPEPELHQLLGEKFSAVVDDP